MVISLQVEAPDLADEDLQQVTRELCHAINDETEVSAEVPAGETVAGGRGEPITVGLLALTFLTSGTAVALLQVVRAYFERSAALKVALRRQDGKTFEIRAENLSADQIDQTLDLAKAFLGDSP